MGCSGICPVCGEFDVLEYGIRDNHGNVEPVCEGCFDAFHEDLSEAKRVFVAEFVDGYIARKQQERYAAVMQARFEDSLREDGNNFSMYDQMMDEG